MSTTEFCLLSGLRVGRYYKVITFQDGVRYFEILMGKIDTKKITCTDTLGKLLEIRQYGRPFDPDLSLYFEDTKGNKYEYYPSFGIAEGFVEYEFDNEELSKQRTQERTKILQIEIEGNDWALRPENVVATQGLNITAFSP
jgi:hypothetical protein